MPDGRGRLAEYGNSLATCVARDQAARFLVSEYPPQRATGRPSFRYLSRSVLPDAARAMAACAAARRATGTRNGEQLT